MKIVFHYAAGPKIEAMLDPYRTGGTEIVCCPEGPDQPFLNEIKDADVIWHVLKPLTPEILEQAPKLKLIQKIGVGVNTIDLQYAEDNGIAVSNMPGSNSSAVAEMALLLMMSTLRSLPLVDKNCRDGVWDQDASIKEGLSEISGLTIGLVGFGRTPQLLAPILDAMQARVVYANRNSKDAPYEHLPLNELLAQSDIVSLHLPLTLETEQIIDDKALAQMKPGAILINTARGALVDEVSLVSALKSGRLAGAGLDVFAQEPVASDNELLKLPNVTVTPHIAWLTRQTWSRSIEIAVQNAKAVMSSDVLVHRVV